MDVLPVPRPVLPVGARVVGGVRQDATGLRLGAAPVGVVHHHVQLGITVVERLKHILPWRLEVLDGRLSVELTGQHVEEVGVEEGKVGEPILLGQCKVVHELLGQHVHHDGAEVFVVQSGPPHGLEVIEDDARVEAL